MSKNLFKLNFKMILIILSLSLSFIILSCSDDSSEDKHNPPKEEGLNLQDQKEEQNNIKDLLEGIVNFGKAYYIVVENSTISLTFKKGNLLKYTHTISLKEERKEQEKEKGKETEKKEDNDKNTYSNNTSSTDLSGEIEVALQIKNITTIENTNIYEIKVIPFLYMLTFSTYESATEANKLGYLGYKKWKPN